MLRMKENNIFFIYVTICTLFWQISVTNSRTSTFWKLNPDEGKITGFYDEVKDNLVTFPDIKSTFSDDEVFNIIASTVVYGGVSWSKQSIDKSTDSIYDSNVKRKDFASAASSSNGRTKAPKKTNYRTSEILDCGRVNNNTEIDEIAGVIDRSNLPSIPASDVIQWCHMDEGEKTFNMNSYEKTLKQYRWEKHRSADLYYKLGNYWRLKGKPNQAIECFRKSLLYRRKDPMVYLSVALVLINVQHYDGALYLTKRSIELSEAANDQWRYYYTLGEIYKAYGQFHEALESLRYALKLNPHVEGVKKTLREVQNTPASPLHVYTLLIIFGLVVAVFIVIVTSTDGSENNNIQQSEFEPKIQRHFNRAMAMRSLKGFSSRTFKHRKN